MTPEIVLTREEIDEIITKCANELNSMYQNSDKIPVLIGVLNSMYQNSDKIPVLIGVLKGALPFMMDLIKKLNFDFIMDFIQVTSYSGTSSTGVIHLKKDITTDIRGKDVVIVEDIIDTGLTLNYLKQYIQLNYNPRDIKICCFVDKKPLRKVDLTADVVGITMNQAKFLVGYGFDYNEIGRNIDHVFVPTKKQLEDWDKKLKNN